MSRRKKEPLELLASLVDERLEGALCTRRAPLFDDFIDDESIESRSQRHREARLVCIVCPVRLACDTAAREHDSTGIWAAHLRAPTTPQRKATA
ncbi:WhiB family transcriptional regulator [Rhodococcus sp. ARC_M8]|uniref:WhiB family transcriptional regulator n=1 Tax=Rhodococcus TaxID=1827 RepID=UPI001411C7B9|nr:MULTISPECIES: WhiB family transcriptional regulator [Rhodococcus]MCJ0947215.1 WhiB family transcriptional regulator [Rhodococcus sp. ARC_M8]UKO87796.1 WhiB family transcriptional regulator [Rhodococcus erythropolis]ULD39435.1 WhiB family transcriptional regulator [Rhodococcus qingshengii]